MSNDATSIEWTDATWNVVTGCDRVSAGCDHCYALNLAKRLKAMGSPRYQRDGNPTTSGPGFGVTLHPDLLLAPLRWQKPRRIFVNSMSDLFHADVPDAFIKDVWTVMDMARQNGHVFQILTKRPRRMRRWVTSYASWFEGAVGPGTYRERFPHVWLGTSVENQAAAHRIDALVKTPAAVRFLSCEPLLGPIDLSRWLWEEAGPEWAGSNPCPDLDWVIAGGESGHGFRPVDLDWARSIRDQCVEALVPFFFKQVGGRTPKAGGRDLDGREWNEMPTGVIR